MFGHVENFLIMFKNYWMEQMVRWTITQACTFIWNPRVNLQNLQKEFNLTRYVTSE